MFNLKHAKNKYKIRFSCSDNAIDFYLTHKGIMQFIITLNSSDKSFKLNIKFDNRLNKSSQYPSNLSFTSLYTTKIPTSVVFVVVIFVFPI